MGPMHVAVPRVLAQDLHEVAFARGIAPREQRQPAEQPDHEQIDEAKEHERRG